MPPRFVGVERIEHVPQPPESELCFAALVSALSRRDLDEVHKVLSDRRFSEEDGTTDGGNFLKTRRIDFNSGSSVTLEPVHTPFMEAETEEVRRKISAQFEAGKAVMLLYKKAEDPKSDSLHWILLTGQIENEGQVSLITKIDPQEEDKRFVNASLIDEMIERSLAYGALFVLAAEIA